jgi:hypothetical protein
VSAGFLFHYGSEHEMAAACFEECVVDDPPIDPHGGVLVNGGPTPLRELARASDAGFLDNLAMHTGVEPEQAEFRLVRIPREILADHQQADMSDFDQGVAADDERVLSQPNLWPPLGYEWMRERRTIVEVARDAYIKAEAVDPIAIQVRDGGKLRILDGYHRLVGANLAAVETIEVLVLLGQGG